SILVSAPQARQEKPKCLPARLRMIPRRPHLRSLLQNSLFHLRNLRQNSLFHLRSLRQNSLFHLHSLRQNSLLHLRSLRQKSLFTLGARPAPMPTSRMCSPLTKRGASPATSRSYPVF